MSAPRNLATPPKTNVVWLKEICDAGNEIISFHNHWVIEPTNTKISTAELKKAALQWRSMNVILFCDITPIQYTEGLSDVIANWQLYVVGFQNINSQTLSAMLEKLNFTKIKKIGIRQLSANACHVLWKKLHQLAEQQIAITVYVDSALDDKWRMKFAKLTARALHNLAPKERQMKSENPSTSPLSVTRPPHSLTLTSEIMTDSGQPERALVTLLQQQIEQLHKNNAELAHNQQMLHTQLIEVGASINHLTHENNNLTTLASDETIRLRADLASLTQERQTLDEQKRQVEDALAAQISMNTLAGEQMNNVQLASKQAEEKIHAKAFEITTLKENMAALQVLLAASRAAGEQTQLTLAEEKSLSASYAESLNELEREIWKVELEREGLRAEINSFEAITARLEAENSAFKAAGCPHENAAIAGEEQKTQEPLAKRAKLTAQEELYQLRRKENKQAIQIMRLTNLKEGYAKKFAGQALTIQSSAATLERQQKELAQAARQKSQAETAHALALATQQTTLVSLERQNRDLTARLAAVQKELNDYNETWTVPVALSPGGPRPRALSLSPFAQFSFFTNSPSLNFTSTATALLNSGDVTFSLN